jgi:hypothetical protein
MVQGSSLEGERSFEVSLFPADFFHLRGGKLPTRFMGVKAIGAILREMGEGQFERFWQRIPAQRL